MFATSLLIMGDNISKIFIVFVKRKKEKKNDFPTQSNLEQVIHSNT